MGGGAWNEGGGGGVPEPGGIMLSISARTLAKDAHPGKRGIQFSPGRRLGKPAASSSFRCLSENFARYASAELNAATAIASSEPSAMCENSYGKKTIPNPKR
jgi:hypothetical protein